MSTTILSYLAAVYLITGIAGGIALFRTARTVRRYIRYINRNLVHIQEIMEEQRELQRKMGQQVEAMSLRAQNERTRRLNEIYNAMSTAINKASFPKQ